MAKLSDKAGGVTTDPLKANLIGAGQVLSDTELTDIAEFYNSIGTTTANENIDFTLGHLHKVVLGVATTTLAFTNPPATGKSGSITLQVNQDATGGRTIIWPAGTRWAGGTAPVLTPTASAIDYFTFVTHSGGITWFGFVAGQDML